MTEEIQEKKNTKYYIKYEGNRKQILKVFNNNNNNTVNKTEHFKLTRAADMLYQ